MLLLSPSPPTPEPISEADRTASRAAFGQRAEAEKTFDKITGLPVPAGWRERVVADNLRTSHAAWDAWLQRGTREDIAALMPHVAVPCRLLVGEHDRAISPATQRSQTLPLLPAGSRLELVPGAGHLLPLEAPSALWEQIK
nr:alpha/beta hydrolase [Hymenobacter sp. BRD67]